MLRIEYVEVKVSCLTTDPDLPQVDREGAPKARGTLRE